MWCYIVHGVLLGRHVPTQNGEAWCPKCDRTFGIQPIESETADLEEQEIDNNVN